MEKVTISELKNRLSAYLKKVRAGQTVIVFDRNRPVARLERIESGGRVDDRLARLERDGLLKRSTGRISIRALRVPGPKSKSSVLDALLEERRTDR